MQMVEQEEGLVEARLRSGEIECSGCGGELRPWGYARERVLRDRGEAVRLRPRRGRCLICKATHVLLPTLALLRRVDVAEVIGEALMATHVERRSRREVAMAAGAPLDTVRGWRRRFGQRAEQIRAHFTTLAHRWDEELRGLEPKGKLVLDALEAIGAAVAAGVRRFGRQAGWGLVAGASGGLLLANTSCPLPAVA